MICLTLPCGDQAPDGLCRRIQVDDVPGDLMATIVALQCVGRTRQAMTQDETVAAKQYRGV